MIAVGIHRWQKDRSQTQDKYIDDDDELHLPVNIYFVEKWVIYY